MLRLWSFQDEFGGGLALFNAIKRAYPFIAGGDFAFYLDLVGWLNNFLKSSANAAAYLNKNLGGGIVDPNVLPKNFWLKRPPDSLCGFQIRGEFDYIGSKTGAGSTLVINQWVSDITDLGAVRNVFEQIAIEALSDMSGSNKAKQKYELLPNSFRFTGSVRIC